MNPKKGFTLLELLAAIVVLVIGIISIVPLFTKSASVNSLTRYNTILAFLAQKKMEEIKMAKSFENQSGQFIEEGYPDISYDLSVSPKSDIPNVFLVELKLNWQDNNRNYSDKIVTYILK